MAAVWVHSNGARELGGAMVVLPTNGPNERSLEESDGEREYSYRVPLDPFHKLLLGISLYGRIGHPWNSGT